MRTTTSYMKGLRYFVAKFHKIAVVSQFKRIICKNVLMAKDGQI